MYNRTSDSMKLYLVLVENLQKYHSKRQTHSLYSLRFNRFVEDFMYIINVSVKIRRRENWEFHYPKNRVLKIKKGFKTNLYCAQKNPNPIY